MAVTQYFNSEFMGRAKTEKISQTFGKGINKLNPESFIQITSDGPNINLYFLEFFAEKKGIRRTPTIDTNWNLGSVCYTGLEISVRHRTLSSMKFNMSSVIWSSNGWPVRHKILVSF